MIESLRELLDWVRAHEALMWWLGAGSVAMFAGSLVLLPWLIGRLPADYFRREDHPHLMADRRPLLRAAWVVGKNLVGLLFVLAGLAMLVLPGQGLLAILVGLTLIDFPGRQELLRRIVAQPQVFQALNWVREKRDKPPLVAPEFEESDE